MNNNELIFAINYNAYLDKRLRQDIDAINLTALVEQAKINDAFDNAIELSNLCESLLMEDGTEHEDILKKKVEDLQKQVGEFAVKAEKNGMLSSQALSDINNGQVYEPLKVNQMVKASDLSFPNNIKFILEQILDWLKRVVKFLISKALVLFYRITGNSIGAANQQLKADQGSYGKLSDLKPQFTQAIKALSTGILKPYQLGTERVGVKGIDQNNQPVYKYENRANTKNSDPVQLKVIDATDWNGNRSFLMPLTEEARLVASRPLNEALLMEDGNNQIKVIELDTSKDLYALQQTVTHFFNLFDQSFGSNGEYLFDSEDLKLVLTTIKKTFDAIKDGNMNPISLANVNSVKSDKVYANLLRTKTNVDNLDKAYYETYAQIDKIMKLVTNKQLYSLSQFGVQYACLSEYTYKAMNSLVDMVDKKTKEAEKLQKSLIEMQKKFDELTVELEKYRTAIYGYGEVTVQTIYQKKFNDLFLSSKYLTQITTLRLTVLTKYIQELQDIKNIVFALSDISRAGRKEIVFANATAPKVEPEKKGFFAKFKK